MKALKECKIKVDMQIFRRWQFGLLSELGMLYGVCFLSCIMSGWANFFFVVTSLHVSDVILLLWQLQFFKENAEYIENGFIQEFHTTESAEI